MIEGADVLVWFIFDVYDVAFSDGLLVGEPGIEGDEESAGNSFFVGVTDGYNEGARLGVGVADGYNEGAKLGWSERRLGSEG